MSKLGNEFIYLVKYAGSGVISTFIGFAIIFALIWQGVQPVAANFIGYSAGLVLGFIFSKKFVFISGGNAVIELVRYLVAFIISYLINLLTLSIALHIIYINQYLAQIISAIAYTICMYILTRLFVYKKSDLNIAA